MRQYEYVETVRFKKEFLNLFVKLKQSMNQRLYLNKFMKTKKMINFVWADTCLISSITSDFCKKMVMQEINIW